MGPDAVSNTVLIQIANYTDAQARSLQAQYGGPHWVTVKPWTGPLHGQLFTNRYYDIPPFFSGDRTLTNNILAAKCTDGFTVVGNVSHQIYNLTAGHCGGSSMYTNLAARYLMGGVAANYLFGGSQLDVENFYCGQCTDNTVWYSDSGAYSVTAWCECNVGAYVTFDGATTGTEVPDAYVEAADVCSAGSFSPDGFTRCFLNEARKNTTICQAGDSGGPVYERQANSTVLATGLIAGGLSNNGYEHCYYSRMKWIMAKLNVSLY